MTLAQRAYAALVTLEEQGHIERRWLDGMRSDKSQRRVSWAQPGAQLYGGLVEGDGRIRPDNGAVTFDEVPDLDDPMTRMGVLLLLSEAVASIDPDPVAPPHACADVVCEPVGWDGRLVDKVWEARVHHRLRDDTRTSSTIRGDTMEGAMVCALEYVAGGGLAQWFAGDEA